ncbi:hypothetical protein O181_041990 [Austropuccinia psidii MF-1]|uniref:Uncharacterized protein n=1 Tax=Austropuccinia psidii MF-1 TaxID=1389203 RepID=A0A9Q3DFV5_9BASI|nr:hypothetical protein [Austropuccinia psidii MF-1]
MDTMINGRTLREIIPTLPLALQYNGNLKPEDLKDMDQVLYLHQLLKDLFQWSIDNKMFDLESHWKELGEIFQKICLKKIPFKDLILITKGWNPDRQFKLLEERATSIRENKATIQAIEEQLNQMEPILIPSGSQLVSQPETQVSSHHSGSNRSVTKSHHSSQSQVVSRRRQGYKGESKTFFSHRKKELDPMIQKLLESVKQLHKSQK